MEREANYAAVGGFVVLIALLAGLFVYWYAGVREHRDYRRYEIYFDGSVSGLSEGGSVRYLGVEVGRVVRIRLDQRAADRVQIIADIDSSTPISDRTVAELSLAGVTGLLYIDLRASPSALADANLAPAVPSEQYPVIRSVRSNFDTFLASLPGLTQRVGELAMRASDALSEQNVAALSHLLANLDRASATLPASMRDAGGLVADLRSATGEAKDLIATLRRTTDAAAPDIAAALRRLRDASDNMARVSNRLDAMIAENRGDVRGFMRDGLPQLQGLVEDGRATARELRGLAEDLRRDPSRIIYQPAASGVEIAR